MESITNGFEKDIANHELKIIVDSGVNRILEFRNKSGSSNQFFIVMQAKGRICFTGDMGEFVFTNHNDDMLAWFHGNMSLSYIAEKCRTGGTKKYCEDTALESIKNEVGHFCADYIDDYIEYNEKYQSDEFSVEDVIEIWNEELCNEVVSEIDFENEWTLHDSASDVSITINHNLFEIDISEGIHSEAYTNRFKWCVAAMNKVAELYFDKNKEQSS